MTKYWVSLAGVVIMMAGTATITLSQLGNAPVSAPIWVFTLMGGPSFGTWTFIVNLVFIFAQKLILREAFPLSGWLQVPTLFIASIALDAWMAALSWIHSDVYAVRLCTTLIGIATLALGVTVMAQCKALYIAGEGFVAAVSTAARRPFHQIKLIFDISNVVVAVILSLAVFHHVEAVREATLITALITGPLVKQYSRFIGPAITKII